jgi:hypothetical protein
VTETNDSPQVEPEPSPLAKLSMEYNRAASFVSSARWALRHGIANAPATLRPHFEQVYREWEEFGGFEMVPATVDEAVEGYQDRSSSMVECAAIILAHSVLDAHLLECVRAIASVMPEAMRRRQVGRNLARLEWVSMPKKMGLLLELCQLPEDWNPRDDYRWDAARLAEIDQRRHRIVHHGAFREPRGSAGEDFEYLVRTGDYAIGLVHHSPYGDVLNVPPGWRKAGVGP